MSAWAFAFPGVGLLYSAYLDEFGHIGPFVSRDHPMHRTSPVFGLGGFVLPSHEVRAFATWFFQLTSNLLAFEIARDKVHPAKWEKRGSSLYTTVNVTTYRELRHATNRILNHIPRMGGHIFYVGTEKRPPDRHNQRAHIVPF